MKKTSLSCAQGAHETCHREGLRTFEDYPCGCECHALIAAAALERWEAK